MESEAKQTNNYGGGDTAILRSINSPRHQPHPSNKTIAPERNVQRARRQTVHGIGVPCGLTGDGSR